MCLPKEKYFSRSNDKVLIRGRWSQVHLGPTHHSLVTVLRWWYTFSVDSRMSLSPVAHLIIPAASWFIPHKYLNMAGCLDKLHIYSSQNFHTHCLGFCLAFAMPDSVGLLLHTSTIIATIFIHLSNTLLLRTVVDWIIVLSSSPPVLVLHIHMLGVGWGGQSVLYFLLRDCGLGHIWLALTNGRCDINKHLIWASIPDFVRRKLLWVVS